MRHSDPNAARNYKLDLLRFICACLVIMIHISLPESKLPTGDRWGAVKRSISLR